MVIEIAHSDLYNMTLSLPRENQMVFRHLDRRRPHLKEPEIQSPEKSFLPIV